MKCRKYRQAIILYLYGELGEDEQRRLNSHLESCPACRAELDETRRVFHLAREADPAEIPDADWDRCWSGIRRQMRRPPRMRSDTHFLVPRWAPAAAAGLIVVFSLGFFLGRSLLSKPEPRRDEVSTLSPAAARMSIGNHFETIKPLLIEYANYDEKSNGSRITTDRALLKNLLIQNILLMRLLAEEDPEAAELFEDIELVLREISNLKSGDHAAPIQIRELLDEREILFKMDIFRSF